MIGAHFDHIGLGGPGSGSRKPNIVQVHPGADDNARWNSRSFRTSPKTFI